MLDICVTLLGCICQLQQAGLTKEKLSLCTQNLHSCKHAFPADDILWVNEPHYCPAHYSQYPTGVHSSPQSSARYGCNAMSAWVRLQWFSLSLSLFLSVTHSLTHSHTDTHAQARTYTCTHARTHTHTHTYTYTHAHTHAHARAHTPSVNESGQHQSHQGSHCRKLF